MPVSPYAENTPREHVDEVDAVTIDCLVFGLYRGELKVLLVRHGEGIKEGQWGLPGGWIHQDEDLDEAAARLLNTLTGVKDTYLEQFRAFGAPDRYPGKRVITIAYYALVKPEHYHIVAGFTASEVKWEPLHHCTNLIFDHADILIGGLQRLRTRVRTEPIGFNLLPEKFTLLQIQELYETVLDIELDKSNFRRKLLKMGLLVKCDEKQQNVAHRAANLYRFDQQKYQELRRGGFSFDL